MAELRQQFQGRELLPEWPNELTTLFKNSQDFFRPDEFPGVLDDN